MALNLAEDALISQVSALGEPVSAPVVSADPLAGSQTLTGLEVRLSRVFIKDNHTPRVGPFPGKADLYLLVIVVDNRSASVRTITLDNFPGINDQEALLVDRAVYSWEPAGATDAAPTQLHVLVSVLKSKQRLRDTGALLAQAQASAPYQGLLTRMGGALATAGQAPSLLLQMGSVVGSLLTNVEDKTLFTQVVSFTGLNGDFDTLGKTPHPEENQYVASTLTLIVRDALRPLPAPAG
jgi:hypothetical protein